MFNEKNLEKYLEGGDLELSEFLKGIKSINNDENILAYELKCIDQY